MELPVMPGICQRGAMCMPCRDRMHGAWRKVMVAKYPTMTGGDSAFICPFGRVWLDTGPDGRQTETYTLTQALVRWPDLDVQPCDIDDDPETITIDVSDDDCADRLQIGQAKVTATTPQARQKLQERRRATQRT